MASKSALTPLLPISLPGDVRYARGVRAGRWIFATGHKASAQVVDPTRPAAPTAGT